jgi:hypothetical protein
MDFMLYITFYLEDKKFILKTGNIFNIYIDINLK